jgi:hypothetical protein
LATHSHTFTGSAGTTGSASLPTLSSTLVVFDWWAIG